MLLAITGFLVLAVGHSVLGERGVIRPVLAAVAGAHLPFGSEGFGRVVRVAWHLTSLAWVGLAAALAFSADARVGVVAGVVAACSGLAILVAAKGRHPAWVVFAVTAAALLHGRDWLPRVAGASTAAALFAVAALHLAWVGGLRWGLGAVLPVRADGARALDPSRALTAAVAVAVAGAGALALVNAGFVAAPAIARPLGWCAAAVFAARTVGDFSLVGLFKKTRDTTFARFDDALFTPVCFSLAAGFVLTLS
jgi:hypothetical protein